MAESAAVTQAPPTMPPTPTPSATPLISDTWYVERYENLISLLLLNGGASSRAAADRIVRSMDIDPHKPMVALTFDDGPTPGVTDKILNVLEKYNARATFFVVGSRVSGNEDLLRRAVCLGCEIGSHTFGHDELKDMSESRQKETVEKTSRAVYEACGYTIRSLRPPEGQNSDSIKSLAAVENVALIYWNHSTHDYRLSSPDTIASYVQYDKENKKAVEPGDIILMHDLRRPTAEAMEQIVKTLTEQGYQLVTVQELLYMSEDGFTPGKSYKKQ